MLDRKVSMVSHRGSYMNANALLNLLNELGKRDKMRELTSMLFLFRNEFNKFNNKKARMLNSIYYMALKILKHRIFDVKTSIISFFFTQLY